MKGFRLILTMLIAMTFAFGTIACEKKEEAPAEEPAAEEPAAEEPAAEPPAEEPVVEEPPAEEPAAAEGGTNSAEPEGGSESQ